MLPGRNLVRECPSCSGHIIEPTMTSGNTFGALFWPDGKMEAPMMPDYPAYVSCPHCKSSFWIEDIKLVKSIGRDEEIEIPDLILDTSQQQNPIPYKDPTIATFLLALEVKGLTKGREGYIRTKLMHFFNDVNRDMEIPISEPSDMQIENYKRLLVIANKNDANDTILRAEIYREIGEYEKSLELLAKVKDEDFATNVLVLKELCKNKDSRVMEILRRED